MSESNRSDPEGGAERSAMQSPAILIVEDEVLLRFLLADELRAAGHAVVEALDAEEALTVLAGPRPIALVITDIRMPGAFDGEELVRRLRADHPHVKVLIASAHAPSADLAGAVDGHFSKPYELPALVARVKSLLAG